MPKRAHVALIRELTERVAAQGTRARAAQERRYLKSDLEFLGAGMPVIRREAKALSRRDPDLSRAGLKALVSALWETRVHELRAIAIGLLEQRTDLLRKADAAFLIGLVRDSKTWAYVDWLATKVLGALLVREPTLQAALVRWAKDPDFWVRRTALLALHDPLLQGRGNFELFARLAVPMLGDKEFFIRKAIGWVLRSTSRRTPELTRAFVAAHARELSGLSFGEAIKHLPANQQQALRELASVRRSQLGSCARRPLI
ncbi:MAG TPA: DNA alkylation repair protein [Polyangiales bacterium]|nr:DNA alkylation repair protein [Polyangiales bacterium]